METEKKTLINIPEDCEFEEYELIDIKKVPDNSQKFDEIWQNYEEVCKLKALNIF